MKTGSANFKSHLGGRVTARGASFLVIFYGANAAHFDRTVL